MEEIKFKDVLMKALYMEEGKEQVNVTQGSEFLKCVLEILANDYTDEEILSLINDYRTNEEESIEDYPDEWAYLDKNLRTKVEASLEIIIGEWIILPLSLLLEEDVDESDGIKATDMEGNPLEVKRDTDVIHGPQVYYINIGNLKITNQNRSVSIMIYYND